MLLQLYLPLLCHYVQQQWELPYSLRRLIIQLLHVNLAGEWLHCL